MERKKASEFPQELLDLFHEYVHGDITRRAFMERSGKFAVGGWTTAALFEALKPNYAWAQNRGLNPYIEDVARRLGTENFMAFAPDGLTSVGGYPGDDEKGGALFGQVDREKMTQDFMAAAMYLKNHPDSTGSVGVVGFCFGGGIANTLAVRMPDVIRAAVPFYGAAPAAEDVPKIKAAILAHHGELDTRLAGGQRRITASITTRRPATTKPPPSSRGSGPSRGSTSICVSACMYWIDA
jgi:carboxymethylenebutenolidase